MPNLEIMWTKVDEAPALATYSLLPIIEAFVGAAGVSVKLKDISLAGRILASVSDKLPPAQQTSDELAELGALTLRPEANIMKLPNISASIPQLRAAIKELQGKGYEVPDYPDTPATEAEKDIKSRYDKVFGSVVNPVLREGNSDRRAAGAVKQFARNNPHKMGTWSKDSKSHVAHMSGGDYYGSEISTTVASATNARIELVGADGAVTVLKAKTPLQAGEIIDAAVLSRKALRAFFAEQIEDAKKQGVLFSLHVKATMMKIADPIVFGHVVSEFFADVIKKHDATLKKLGVNLNNGFGDLLTKIETLPEAEKEAIKADIEAAYAKRPGLAMVNSDKGITCLHVPSDIIIDASIPAMIRESGRMWGADGKLHDTKAVVPDRAYATAVPGGHRRLQGQRRVRPQDHGLGSERRLDGAEGRGIRLARQDLRSPRGWNGSRRRRRRQGAAGAPGRDRRHLPHVPDQGRADPGLGQARRAPRAHHRRPGCVLARRQASA